MNLDFNQKESRQQRSFKTKDHDSRDQYDSVKKTKYQPKEKYNSWKNLSSWEDYEDEDQE